MCNLHIPLSSVTPPTTTEFFFAPSTCYYILMFNLTQENDYVLLSRFSRREIFCKVIGKQSRETDTATPELRANFNKASTLILYLRRRPNLERLLTLWWFQCVCFLFCIQGVFQCVIFPSFCQRKRRQEQKEGTAGPGSFLFRNKVSGGKLGGAAFHICKLQLKKKKKKKDL